MANGSFRRAYWTKRPAGTTATLPPCQSLWLSDTEIVAGAWDFERINRRYARYLKVLEEHPIAALRNERAAKALLRWATTERETWLHAVTSDPLLPARLLPSSYLGERAWQRRVKVLRNASRQLRTFDAANS